MLCETKQRNVLNSLYSEQANSSTSVSVDSQPGIRNRQRARERERKCGSAWMKGRGWGWGMRRQGKRAKRKQAGGSKYVVVVMQYGAVAEHKERKSGSETKGF
eukprot:2263614-Pleurochrysis_carterae.AAC.8